MPQDKWIKSEPLQVDHTPEPINKWRKAMYAALDESGIHWMVHILIHPLLTHDLYEYSWHYEGEHPNRDIYEAFHKAIVVCEAIRPANLVLSPKAKEMING